MSFCSSCVSSLSSPSLHSPRFVGEQNLDTGLVLKQCSCRTPLLIMSDESDVSLRLANELAARRQQPAASSSSSSSSSSAAAAAASAAASFSVQHIIIGGANDLSDENNCRSMLTDCMTNGNSATTSATIH